MFKTCAVLLVWCQAGFSFLSDLTQATTLANQNTLLLMTCIHAHSIDREMEYNSHICCYANYSYVMKIACPIRLSPMVAGWENRLTINIFHIFVCIFDKRAFYSTRYSKLLVSLNLNHNSVLVMQLNTHNIYIYIIYIYIYIYMCK